MPPTFRRALYTNPSARTWTSSPSAAHSPCEAVAKFHNSLPGFGPSRLISLDEVPQQLGLRRVFLKDETGRLGLPSFKILGASWAVYRAIVSKFHLNLDAPIAEVSEAAQKHDVKLFAATDGNHGRAVARMAKWMGIHAEVHVPVYLDLYTRDLIASEGADVVVGGEGYDEAVMEAYDYAAADPRGLFVQDTAWEGYEEIPQWIVEGYSTMMREIDEQLAGGHPDLIVVPVGVGSFAQAVVSHSKREGRRTAILTVEPYGSACLWESLTSGKPLPIHTSNTIMSGMNCGTVSSAAWPILQSAVDFSCTISDHEAHEAVQYLESQGISVGPCGAAPLAALRHVMQENAMDLSLGPDSTVVLLCSEGSREYIAPFDVSSTDATQLTR